MEKANMARLTCPFVAHLRITEVTPQSWGPLEKKLALAGLICPSQNDLDNQIKAIFDGLNGVVYKDDKQLTQVFAIREYGPAAGFTLAITPVGMTASDVATVKRLVAIQVKKAKSS
jgi:hypothetical protein